MTSVPLSFCRAVLVVVAASTVLVSAAPGARTTREAAGAQRADEPPGTFSILGFDPETGEIGGAVASRVFSVGNGVLGRGWSRRGRDTGHR